MQLVALLTKKYVFFPLATHDLLTSCRRNVGALSAQRFVDANGQQVRATFYLFIGDNDVSDTKRELGIERVQACTR